ncbi:hypothetical protein MIND_01029000 [Mycena indigotica]|uniref:Mitotic checkpoint regulator, MAD2B-interacting-domain-containing protein n=1 Tax=Mycena indigotica TaxID=2126181 RepID=A0A8H6SBQ4_9AGAR|nr:uncharacterized protein MIND_01029000 [Mycena indigotica]KAF7294910.1 hypothetical protein MIND_01029000 [Mycena indigotica]
MNLGLGDYGSDSEHESEAEDVQTKPAAAPTPAPAPKKRPPKKITIGLPALSPAVEDDDLDGERPPAKKARLEPGAGKSLLLSMLPAPKEKNPILPAPQRTLGGGAAPALDFETAKPEKSESIAFRPTSLTKGKTNVNLEDGASGSKASSTRAVQSNVDFFSLAGPSIPQSTATPELSVSRPSVSSAPNIPKFEPPEPTPNDPYPGYYTLPSGTWAAYDPAYYAKFTKKWQAEYDAHVRALEKGKVKGFEELDNAEVEEINAEKEREKAKKEFHERETRKAMTMGGSGPSAPNIKLTASKSSRIANSRHQLATMLHQAYANREALEEKIAEGKRNRKEAGNKYGF